MAAKFFALMFTLLALAQLAHAGEYSERAMCANTSSEGSFVQVSVQRDPINAKRGILILLASDGWTQVYSGNVKETSSQLIFSEDTKIISAKFEKGSLTASTSFGADTYRCDERSFGN